MPADLHVIRLPVIRSHKKYFPAVLFKGQLYFILSQVLHGLGIQSRRSKEWFEWLYWQWQKWREGRLAHEHYAYFFTEYFGLSAADYAGKKVLDIGCGPRGSLEWAVMATERIGLDPLADKYLEMGASQHSMTYIQGTAEQIPFPDGYFDLTASFNSLDHTDELSASIAEIKRVTAPGGYFLLISDIHLTPTLCEPSAFGWDIVSRFEPEMTLIRQRAYEGNALWRSIRAGVPFDHQNPAERYGVLTALFRRRA